MASSAVGGLEKHVQELSAQLAKSEEVSLIAPEEMRSRLPANVNFIPVDFKRSRFNLSLWWELLRILRQGRFDIVHAHANKAASLVSAIQRWLPGKTIGTVHNYKSTVAAFAKLDAVVAVSYGVKQQFKGKVNPTVIYNGINREVIATGYTKSEICSLFQLDVQKPLLCSIGRLVEAKGFDLLINALSGLDLNLLIIGGGPLFEPLQEQINRMGLQGKIKLIGHRADVASLLPGIDGVVISSKREGFSYVFAEALLAERPVLATDVPICNELLPRAFIMEKTSQSIHDKLQQYVFEPVQWREGMTDVFNKARQELTLGAMTERTLALYREILTK